MIETRKIVKFVVEIYELERYWQFENEHNYNFDAEVNSYKKVNATIYRLTPGCYKKTYYERFNSISKLNKALGLKKKNYYYFHKSLEDAIKGAYGEHYASLINGREKILVVRQIHNLDNRYIYQNK